jgi:myo-inositol-1(or 4)-monophosphatase
MDINIEQLTHIVKSASQDVLMPHFNAVKRQYKPDGSIVTDADMAMQQRLESALLQSFPGITLLGEEMSPEQQQMLLASGKPLWCVDPIDGTSNFAAGFPYFCVSIALIENGESTLGLVYDPIHDECFIGKKHSGATLNGEPLDVHSAPESLDKTIASIDFKRLPHDLSTRLIIDKPYASQRSLGSITLELCWLAAGRTHVYLHGKQHLWDYAAADLILREAGGHTCTLEGDNVFNHSLQPRSSAAACNQGLFQQWQTYLGI